MPAWRSCDRLPQLAGADRVEADRRLVEEEHRRVVQEAAGDVQPLLHPARVALDALPSRPISPTSSSSSSIRGALLARRHAVDVREVAEVVERGEPVVEAAVAAEDVADALPHLLASADTSKPRTRAVPEVGSSSVVSILIVVVLPAPFGPSRPNSSPSSTAKLIPRTASTSTDPRRNVPVVVL